MLGPKIWKTYMGGIVSLYLWGDIVILYLWGDSSQSPTYPITPTVGEYNFNHPPCCNY